MVERVIRQDRDFSSSMEENPSINDSSELTIIKSDDLNSLFNEWLTAGKNDLIIDTKLLQNLQGYIEYQKHLSSLMTQVIEQELQRYLVPYDLLSSYNRDTLTIKYNGSFALRADIYPFFEDDAYSCIRLSNLRILLAYMGNRFASSAFQGKDSEYYVNLRVYLLEKGYNISIKQNVFYIEDGKKS